MYCLLAHTPLINFFYCFYIKLSSISNFCQPVSLFIERVELKCLYHLLRPSEHRMLFTLVDEVRITVLFLLTLCLLYLNILQAEIYICFRTL